ncbi:MAG TPA: response regulator [Tepidisphaeraceae bacterium]|jgi:CheY-like chemotaxis protein
MVTLTPPVSESERRSARVLIAEDDRTTRNAARVALQLDGHLVAEAADGPAVLEIIQEEPPDVLVLDLDLRGIGGIFLLDEIAQRKLAIPVIVMTACRESGLVGDLMRLGASGLLHKPVTAANLKLAVRTALEEPFGHWWGDRSSSEGAGGVDREMTNAEPKSPAIGKLALREWLDRVIAKFGRGCPGDHAQEIGDCAAAVRDASLAIRLRCFEDAERILESAGDAEVRDAAWLNLMGVVHESRGDWRRAKRFYGKAMRADRRFAPAEQNMRRWYELFTFGRTQWPVAMGDNRAAE